MPTKNDTLLLLLNLLIIVATPTKLQCNTNKNTFRIVQFTDTHFGESHISDYMTASVMNKILDKEKPDLVVLSGDIVSGYTWNGKQGWFGNLWKKVVQPMIQRNIHWIFTPGNHDCEGEWNRSQIIQFEMDKYSNMGSLTHTGFTDTESGQNIYFVDIHNSKGAIQPILRVWMIDSGMTDCNNGSDYFGCVRQSQMQWYSQQSHDIPGIVYMHIPSVQTMNCYKMNKYPFIGQWTGDALNCFDERDLEKNKDWINDYINKDRDIIAMFHGHEHRHDSLILCDLLLGFGRKTGEGWMIGVDVDFMVVAGARVFEFECDNPKQWKSWIRDKHLSVSDVITFEEMKKRQKQSLSHQSGSGNEHSNVQCLSAQYWKSWKPSVTYKFKHWLTPYVIDIVDVICRLRIPNFINDYIWDIGMEKHKDSKLPKMEL